MSDAAFRPVLYLKAGCPHCFKLRLFLTEAGLIDGFDLREFVPGDTEEAVIRDELAPHFDKVTFPSVQVEPGSFKQDSDAIIAHYAGGHGVDPASLPLTRTCIDTLLPRLRKLRSENRALEARLAALTSDHPEAAA